MSDNPDGVEKLVFAVTKSVKESIGKSLFDEPPEETARILKKELKRRLLNRKLKVKVDVEVCPDDLNNAKIVFSTSCPKSLEDLKEASYFI